MDDFYRVPLSTGEATATVAVLRVVCALLQQEGVAPGIAPELLESAASRIEAELPDFMAGSAEKLCASLTETLAHPNFSASSGDREIGIAPTVRAERTRRLLETAWRTSGVAEIEYYVASRNEWTTRTVAISDVYENDGAWYLEGECRLRRDHRMFRLEHIRAVRVQNMVRTNEEPDDESDELFDPFDEEGNPA